MAEAAVLVYQTWRVAKSENSAAIVRKVLAAGADLGPPVLDFVATDSPVGGGVSATARALRKFPDLAPFATEITPAGAALSIPGLSTSASGDRLPLATDLLLAVLDSVPRSLPFHQVGVTLAWPAPEQAQVRIGDMWWVNGRMRSLSMTWHGQADASSKAPPAASPALAALVAALGKPKSTTRQPAGAMTVAPRELFEIVQRYRTNLETHSAALPLPHLLASGVIGEAAGPMKPALVNAFGPRGFDCRGESGAFSLRRRTPSNHVVELWLDVGTWSHSFSGFLSVHVPGYRATLPLVVAPGRRQVPIVGAAGWAKIVANLEVVVDDLERTFVPEVEAAAGAAPEWFEPGRM